MSREQNSYDTPFPSWRIERTDTGQLDPRGMDVKGLRLHNLMNSSVAEGRSIHIMSEKVKDTSNTEQRAHQLRKMAMSALSSFGIEGGTLADAEFVVAEMVQNAHRYSYTGPLWLSIVSTVERPDIVNVTVANEIADPPKVYPHEDDDTHGRGEIIMEGFAVEHGRFEGKDRLTRKKNVLAAYALLKSNIHLAA